DPVDRGALVAEAREAIDRRRDELLPRRLGPFRSTPAPPRRHTERSVSSVTRPVNTFVEGVRTRARAGRGAGVRGDLSTPDATSRFTVPARASGGEREPRTPGPRPANNYIQA